eukprot:jgi/Phyca11/108637/e_gw1.15.494.1
MIATGRVAVFATDNPTLCRVKQIPKPFVHGSQEAEALDELCSAIDQPFRASAENLSPADQESLLLGEALMVREQRTRAAQLYDNVVSWSLWYAHITSMPTSGWIVDIEKCTKG